MFCECTPPGGKYQNEGGGESFSFFNMNYPRGHLPGGQARKHAHYTHETWTRSTSSSSGRRGKWGRRRRGRGEHVGMLGPSRRRWIFRNKKKEGSAFQGVPRPAVHAAQDDRKHWAHLARAQSRFFFGLLLTEVCGWVGQSEKEKAWSGRVGARYRFENPSGQGT